jgi:hypothetical protein
MLWAFILVNPNRSITKVANEIFIRLFIALGFEYVVVFNSMIAIYGLFLRKKDKNPLKIHMTTFFLKLQTGSKYTKKLLIGIVEKKNI